MKKALCISIVLLIFTMMISACTPQGENISGENIRSQIVGVEHKVTLADGSESVAINFDNAATTPAFQPVVDEVETQLADYGSIGRGKGQKSEHSTEIYENGRKAILNFVGADPEKYTVFYANNTTDGLNKLASALITDENDIVLTSRMEHHANDLPWRHLGKTIYAEVDDQGRLILADMERLLKENDGKVKYISVTAASNVTGYVNDVHAIAKLAHQYGAEIIVDGAQIVAHRAFSMTGETPEENIDYFVFSAHKMYSPFGSGAVVGLNDQLDQHMPEFYGGGMVNVVTDNVETYLSAPELYEAGSPNYPGVVGMLKAIEILEKVGFEYIADHEQKLMRQTIDGLEAIDGVTLYGDTKNIADKVGIVVFNIDGMSHGDVAEELAGRSGIAVRQGAFCSHPYVFRLLGIPDSKVTEEMYADDYAMPGMVRISFGIYNDEKEVETLIETVKEIAEHQKAK